MAYDSNNTFARILRGELPCEKVYEDDYALAFHDINPLTPIHVLVVPRGAYVDYEDFIANAPSAEILGFLRAVKEVAAVTGLAEQGYRLSTNNGPSAGQIVFHFHVHLLGGRPLGGMVRRQTTD